MAGVFAEMIRISGVEDGTGQYGARRMVRELWTRRDARHNAGKRLT